MPYYTSPGGPMTARTARALQDAAMQGLELEGLGILPTVNVRMPRAIPAAFSAARRARMRVISGKETPGTAVMTGMGAFFLPPPGPYPSYRPSIAVPAPVQFAALRTAAAIRAAQIAAETSGGGTSGLGGPPLPKPPVTYPHRPSPVPAAVEFAAAIRAGQAIRAAQIAETTGGGGMRGLGAGGGARVGPKHFGIMPITAAGVRHQAAMFMSPGGGYSQIPGFMPAVMGPPVRRLSFLGQDYGEPTQQISAPTDLTPPIVPPPTQQIFLLPTPSTPPVPSTYTAPTNLIPPSAGGNPIGVQYKPITFLPSVPPAQPFMSQAPLGIPNQYLVAIGAGIIFLTVIAGRRRRSNPDRRRKRRAR